MNKPPEKLIEYGESFLSKSIETLLLNYDFFIQFRTHFKLEYFQDSLPHKFLIEKIFEYYDKYNILPTVDILESINNVNENEYLKDKINIILQQIKVNIIAQFEKSHYDYYINELKQYRQRQIYIQTIKESVNLVKLKEFKKIDSLFHKTVEDIDLDFQIYDYLEEFDNRMHPDSRHGIKTLWPEVDKMLEGSGPMAGEIGFIMGEMNIGKSFCLIQLAVNALKQNKNVLYVTLETRRRQVALRFDSLITDIPLLEFRSRHDEIKKKVYDFFKDRRPPFIEEFPTGGLSIPELYSCIKRIKTKKCKDLDLLIIDYLDIMDMSSYNGAEWQNLKTVYEEARKLGFNEGMPVWSATHPNTEGINSEVMKYNHTSGGPNKFKNVDFIITINQRKDDKGKFAFIAKNRIGPAGSVLDMELDTYKPYIHIGSKADPNTIKKDKEMTQGLKDLLKQVNG